MIILWDREPILFFEIKLPQNSEPQISQWTSWGWAGSSSAQPETQVWIKLAWTWIKEVWHTPNHKLVSEQAGAELGQAQPNLRLKSEYNWLERG